MSFQGRICSRGVWDESIPGISFDESGESNYAKLFDKLVEGNPRGEKGQTIWGNFVKEIKKSGQGEKYDCIVGVSGGTDSSYLLYLAKVKYGLRPLAVNLDNGWSSIISVTNIKKVTNALGIDLETFVIDYEEVKKVLRAYIKASLPWIDSPTDLAIKASLYKIAKRERIKYILNGSDFRSEGKQPTEWTYGDAKQMKFLAKAFENTSLKSFPYYTMFQLFVFGYVRNIKMIRPLNLLDYNKKSAQEFLSRNFEWEYYGGHHHENIFTKFVIAYWMPEKFGIDKRKISLSSQVLAGEMTRDEALKIIEKSPYDTNSLNKDLAYILKKLDFTEEEFQSYFKAPNKYYYDYPSYMPLLKRYYKFSKSVLLKILPFTPTFFYEYESRNL
jgi:N-acetyl sugar amidotransferase